MDGAPTTTPSAWDHTANATAAAAAPAKPASGSQNPANWKCADVEVWLTDIELPQHARAFKQHSIDGKLLLTLNEQDLYSILNVVSPLHRKKIMMEIAELRSFYLNP